MIKEFKIKEKIRKISRCIDCPYFCLEMGSCFCEHPKMKKLGVYGNLINIHTENEFPDNCPL
jgi:hypothetical protein